MRIGVFDSGIGGKSVANAISRAFPSAEILYRQDKENAPYGEKSTSELIDLVLPFIQEFNREKCDVIVIACNTVTTNIIDHIRVSSSCPVIGIEPMVKPAASQTKSKVVAVCATPKTLSSKRYAQLKKEYAKDMQILEPDCSEWSQMIENNDINNEEIKKQIITVCEQGADQVVLGCTHYHWIEKEVKEIAAAYNANVLQPEEAIVRRLKQVLEQLS